MKRIAPFALILGFLFGATTSTVLAADALILTASNTESEDWCWGIRQFGSKFEMPGYCVGGEDGTCQPDYEGSWWGQYCVEIDTFVESDGGGRGEPHTYCCDGFGYSEQAAGVTYETHTASAFLVLTSTAGTDDLHRLLAGDRILPPCGGSTKQKLALFQPGSVVHFQVLRFVNKKPQIFDAVSPAQVLQVADLQEGQVLSEKKFVAATGHEMWDFLPRPAESQQP